MVFRNPGTFYWSLATPQDWTLPQNADLWQDGVKTLFDPCPSGWRVPKGGRERQSVWYNFGGSVASETGVGIPNAVEIQQEDSPTAGFRFFMYGQSGATVWYPNAGFREPDGKIKYYGRSALVWTTTRMDERRMHDFYYYPGGVRCWGGDVNGYGNSVRCIRE